LKEYVTVKEQPLQDWRRGKCNADSVAIVDATANAGSGLEHSRRTGHNIRISVVVWYVIASMEHTSFSMPITARYLHEDDELT
jgi:hypothetical protein